jgi:hypothetical protein
MKEKFKCDCCNDFKEVRDQYINKELIDDDKFWEKEMAWLFYKSGIIDLREEKQMSIWLNNRGII